MKIQFTDSEQVVMDVLKDKRWHCLAVELTGKSVDYRARITQEGAIQDKLEERGYTIENEPCKFHRHKGGVLMRRIVPLKSPLNAPRSLDSWTDEDYYQYSQEMIKLHFTV